MSRSQKLANATDLHLEGFRDGKVREAVETYIGARYTQHITGVAEVSRASSPYLT